MKDIEEFNPEDINRQGKKKVIKDLNKWRHAIFMTLKVHIIKRSKVTAVQNPSRFYKCKKNDYLILTIQTKVQ